MRSTQARASRADSKRARSLSIGGLLLLATVLDLGLLRPLLSRSSLAPEATLRAYYEPRAEDIAVMLDRQHAGYITDLEVHGIDLEIPAGRTIAIPLRHGSEIVLRTLAPDLAPYIVLGTLNLASEPGGAMSLADASIIAAPAGTLEARPWDASLPWANDKERLRDLHARCNLPSQAEASIRTDGNDIAIQLGSCAGKVQLPAGSPGPPLLVVVTGPHAAVASNPALGWQQNREVAWRLIGLVLLRIVLLAFAAGSAPTALVSGALFAMGQLWHTAAVLVWGMTFPIVVAAAAARLVAHRRPQRTGLAWAGGLVVLGLEIGAIVAAIMLLDIGTFGHEHMTRAGDGHCSIVGYSTVRGDSLRRDSDGLIERLNKSCAECRNRTSRFSREAQTLRWVREVVCSPSFPAPNNGEVVFLGGGNDDLFYRPTGFAQILADFAGTLRYVAQPIGARNWEEVFGQANQRAAATLDDQAADIAAIAHCAMEGGRTFYFVHDFLVWDLDRGRSPARQLTFERRRQAVLSAGGRFIDLLEEFRQSAGVAWLNDFIHPSGVGQQMIADLLCERLAEKQWTPDP